jgi:hypothetical protein
VKKMMFRVTRLRYVLPFIKNANNIYAQIGKIFVKIFCQITVLGDNFSSEGTILGDHFATLSCHTDCWQF